MSRSLAVVFCVILVALQFGPLGCSVLAKGRCFPIETTGVIRSVDTAQKTCQVQLDEPSRILTIGYRRDCTFIRHGEQTKSPDFLKKGEHVKVSYFATIFTGNLATEIEANPEPQWVRGVVERIDPASRRLTLRLQGSRPFVVRWAASAHFANGGSPIAPTKLKQGMTVEVGYYAFEFENNYAVKVERL